MAGETAKEKRGGKGKEMGQSFVLSHPFKDQGEGGDFFEKMGEGGCRKVQQLPKI